MVKGREDSGHGGGDSGAVGGGHKEKDMALRIGRYHANYLINNGVSVERTRSSDVAVRLGDRNPSSYRGDFFVSNHINSASPSAEGLEVLYNNNHPQSKRLAQCILDELWATGLYKKNRGLKYRDNLAVLRSKNTPAALVEYGFISNTNERNMMLKNEKVLGEATARGILKFLGKESKPTMDKKEMENIINDVIDPSRVKGGSPNAHWAYKNYEYVNSIIDGFMTERRFDDRITRGEVITMFARLLQYIEGK